MTTVALGAGTDRSASSYDVIGTGQTFSRGSATIELGDFLEVSSRWPAPTVIIADGPYGIGGFPGDPQSPDLLPDWYQPFVAAWTEKSLPETTLWFWNTEIGWANVHPILEANGWEYRTCHIWDKGPGHIAGNTNSRTLRKYPVVTEVCVQYVRKVTLGSPAEPLTLKEWLRHEWERTGLPLYRANDACGVKNAATRKYLTKCHLWYFPPAEAFERLAVYANAHGAEAGRPYFSLDGVRPATAADWARMRAKFNCEVGITNVWREPPVRGSERLKQEYKSVHMNQKPLRLLERSILASSDLGDIVWEPFGGLCSVAIAARNTRRRSYSAEILPEYFQAARQRLEHHVISPTFTLSAG